MEIQNQETYYDERWAQKKQLNSLKLRRSVKILEFFIDLKRTFKNPSIIELGCGDGRFTSFIGAFGNTDAIELSKKAVQEAQMKYAHVNFFQGDVLSYQFEEANYNVAISQEVIEHINDQPAYINVCHKVLKPGGYLIITTPNKRVFEHMKAGNWSNQPIEKILTPKELKALVSEKFQIIKYESIIMDFGELGYFKIINNKYVRALCHKIGLKLFREYMLSKLGFGLHQVILAKKKK